MFISKANACNGTPQLSFSTSPYCVGSKISFHFSTTGVATVNSYTIDFGDGNDSTANSAGTIDHIYNSSGIFYIKLIRSLTACKDTLIDSITISPKPSAAFSLKLDSICSGQIDSFFANNNSLTYLWSYSSGGSASTQNTGKIFTNSGSSPISVTTKLMVTNGNGCKDSLSKNFVVMPLPNPSFSFNNDSSCSGSTITFTNASSGATKYIWLLGNGGTSNSVSPSQVYPISIGSGFSTYLPKLYAQSAFGCIDSIQKTIRLKQKPDGSIQDPFSSIPYAICDTNLSLISFLDSSVTSSSDSIRIFNWGDGVLDTITNFSAGFSHTYNSNGYFSLKITTTGKNNCSTIRNYKIFRGSNPYVGIVSMGSTTGLCGPTSMKYLIKYDSTLVGTTYSIFSNSSNDTIVYNHPPPDTASWFFQKSSCGFTDIFGVTNSFHIRALAQNACGFTPASFGNITVNLRPFVGFKFSPDTICKNDVISFTDTSTAGKVVPSCTGLKYLRWLISPNSFDTIGGTKLGSPTSWYNANSGSPTLQIRVKDTGYYAIKLVVANLNRVCNNGNSSDTAIKYLRVLEPPIAKYKFSADSGCINLIDTFINQSIGVVSKYKWTIISPASGYTYNSGSGDTSINPRLTFNTPGIYMLVQPLYI